MNSTNLVNRVYWLNWRQCDANYIDTVEGEHLVIMLRTLKDKAQLLAQDVCKK